MMQMVHTRPADLSQTEPNKSLDARCEMHQHTSVVFKISWISACDRKFTLREVLVIGGLLIAGSIGTACHRNSLSTESVNADARGDQDIATAFKNHSSNVQVEGEGIVIKVLPDDLQKPRHQRFILRLASGQTVLVAHNIDLAPRVDGLLEGDQVAFKGQYEWNDKGGVVHRTHLDPVDRHNAGWLRHQGKVYQ
jgi:Protein of unknown function (DUF3465)